MKAPSFKKILVNGANGVLGCLVLSRIPASLAVPAVRRVTEKFSNLVHISNDGLVDPRSLEGIDAIINCAGLVSGSPEDIWQANVDHPIRLARSAKFANVRNFVQLSSFSVFERCEYISTDTKFEPANVYGKSKLAAERALLQMSSSNFGVSVVRFPFMFGVQNPAMLGSLINALTKAPAFPTSAKPVYRSILTYSDGADLLIQAAGSVQPNVIMAADPQLFSLPLLARLMKDGGLKTSRLIQVPSLATDLSKLLMPRLSERLFTSNILAPNVNWAANFQLKTGIVSEISKIISNRIPIALEMVL